MSVPSVDRTFEAIIDELEYQDEIWGTREPDAYSGGAAFDRSLDEYTLYIERYTHKLASENCRTPEDYAQKMHLIRKVAALCVACMAQHGPLTRLNEQMEKQNAEAA